LAYKNKYLTKYKGLKQETSLGVLIRNVINRFIQAGSVNKGIAIGRPPESEEAVWIKGMTRARLTIV
jgi:hypothetical protein